jgi:hypothetical protein
MFALIDHTQGVQEHTQTLMTSQGKRHASWQMWCFCSKRGHIRLLIPISGPLSAAGCPHVRLLIVGIPTVDSLSRSSVSGHPGHDQRGPQDGRQDRDGHRIASQLPELRGAETIEPHAVGVQALELHTDNRWAMLTK